MKTVVAIFVSLIFVTLSFAISNDDPIIEIQTIDGNTFIGRIAVESDVDVTIVTLSGMEITVELSQIKSIGEAKDIHVEGQKVERSDPSFHRYFFFTSAIPMPKGDMYCSDKCLFFPSLNIALTKNISIMAGATLIPSATLSEQVKYAGLKTTLFQSTNFYFGAGFSYYDWTLFDVGGTGSIFANSTFGKPQGHFSIGLAYGWGRNDDELEVAETPLITFAAYKRLSDRAAFVGESLYLSDLDMGSFPILTSIRFFGKRLAFDLGAVFLVAMEDSFVFPVMAVNFYPKN